MRVRVSGRRADQGAPSHSPLPLPLRLPLPLPLPLPLTLTMVYLEEQDDGLVVLGVITRAVTAGDN